MLVWAILILDSHQISLYVTVNLLFSRAVTYHVVIYPASNKPHKYFLQRIVCAVRRSHYRRPYEIRTHTADRAGTAVARFEPETAS